MENKETIVQKVYDLLKVTIPALNKFPRSQKFSLGDRIQGQLSDLLELYIHAYYLSKTKKRPLLEKANISLEVLRHYYRLAHELNLFSSQKYHLFVGDLHEIGRMTGGWIKSLK